MRVLFVVQNYSPERGPVRYTHGLAVALAKRGHDVSVVTALPHYPLGRPYPGYGWFWPVVRSEDDVLVTRVPLVMGGNHQPIRRLAGFVSFLLTALPALLHQVRPDVLVASLPPVTLAPLAIAVAALRRLPLILIVRDVEPEASFEVRGLGSSRAAQRLIHLSAALYRRADYLVATHASQADVLTGYGISPRNVETITHGVDVDEFLRLAALPTSPMLPRQPGRFLAGYLGTLGVAQDVHLLVEAFADARVRGLPVDLVLMGDGECAADCRNRIARHGLNNVTWLPPVALECVPAVLMQFDLLVCAYKAGASAMPGMIGSKLYEYFAAGKPVLVSGHGAAESLVREAGNGWCCASGAAGELADALAEFLADPAGAARRGLRGRDLARTRFAASDRHDRWETLLKALCRDGSR